MDSRFFEMRIYHAAPGKMPALHARFREHTCALFAKHGIEFLGFWQPADAADAEQRLVYLLAYPSRAARDQSWQDFRADPEWLRAKAESERDGVLVERVEEIFLDPLDFSPLR